jgi:hypothetical protein
MTGTRIYSTRLADGNTASINRFGRGYYGVILGGICVEMVKGKAAAEYIVDKLVTTALAEYGY